MSSGTPYIGSRISLISKAKIRYEGTLFAIDPDNATVALAKVRSFGTEDRQADCVVAPRDDLYEYIIFRGSDIEDLTVCEPPKAQQAPTPLLPQDPAIVQSAVTAHHPGLAPPQPPHMPPPYMAQYYPMHHYNMMPPTQPGVGPGGPPPPIRQSQRPGPPPSATQQKLPLSGAKSTSPASLGRTSPTSDQGIQTDSPLTHSNENRRNEKHGSHQDHGSSQNHESARNSYDNRNRQQYRGNNNWRGSNDIHRGARRGVRGRPNHRGRYNGPHRKDDIMNFEGDFDFETSNAQFNKEDIAKELMEKLKITGKKEGEKPKEEVVEKVDSGIDSAHTNETAEESDDSDGNPVYYDKTKSFFDNITCETNKPRGERVTWSEERKLNTETFGSAWRGGRGRGGFRGRGGVFRGRGGYRGRNWNGNNYGGYNQRYRNDNRSYGGYNNQRYHRSWTNDGAGEGGRGGWRQRGGGRPRQWDNNYNNQKPVQDSESKSANASRAAKSVNAS